MISREKMFEYQTQVRPSMSCQETKADDFGNLENGKREQQDQT